MAMNPYRKFAKSYREKFPEGTRVQLLQVNDDFEDVPTGKFGTVKSIDDMATIFVAWDDGFTLDITFGIESTLQKIK